MKQTEKHIRNTIFIFVLFFHKIINDIFYVRIIFQLCFFLNKFYLFCLHWNTDIEISILRIDTLVWKEIRWSYSLWTDNTLQVPGKTRWHAVKVHGTSWLGFDGRQKRGTEGCSKLIRSADMIDLELPYTPLPPPQGDFARVYFFWKPIQNATKWAMLALWRLGRLGFWGKTWRNYAKIAKIGNNF